MPNIIMADQPSGGVELLASGTYTNASSTGTMTIPVSYTGKRVFVAVKKDGDGGTWNWVSSTYVDVTNIYPDVFSWNVWLGAIRYSTTANQTGSYVSLSDTAITCKQRDANYPVQAGDYYWEIWGVK